MRARHGVPWTIHRLGAYYQREVQAGLVSGVAKRQLCGYERVVQTQLKFLGWHT